MPNATQPVARNASAKSRTNRKRIRDGILLLAAAGALTVLSGCGGDQEKAAPAARPQAMVPAGADTAPVMPIAGMADSTGQTAAGTSGAAGVQERATDTLQAASSKADDAQARAAAAAARNPQVKRGTGGFSLQVGSFGNATNAAGLQKKLMAQGHAAEVEVATIGGRTYHRVVIGGLESRGAAERLGEDLRAQFDITYLIRQK